MNRLGSQTPKWLLPCIVIAQFLGSSVWFAGNAILPDLQGHLGIPASAIGSITSAVQLGFIVGSLIFAYISIADRFSPSRVFWFSAWIAATANLCVVFVDELWPILVLRFGVGLSLAGIYPVGMKIASDWFAGGLGKALGWLVGALVLGTAFPHGLRSLDIGLNWQQVVFATSILAAASGLLIGVFVPDGPHRKAAPRFQPHRLPQLFRNRKFRSAAFGYFGHMWELYTFWAFLPFLIASLGIPQEHSSTWTFFVISLGGISCILGGYFVKKHSSKGVASFMLLLSGLCCLVSPWLHALPLPISLAILIIWGFGVVGDSPQLSTLVAQSAPPTVVGTALTLVNSIGFGITILSIQLLTRAQLQFPLQSWYFILLVPGPILGLWALRRGKHQ